MTKEYTIYLTKVSYSPIVICLSDKRIGPIAQLVELPAHNRRVPGSNPGGPTRNGSSRFLDGKRNLPK